MRKNMRPLLMTLSVYVLALVLGGFLFHVSQAVQELEKENREMTRIINSEKEGIRVLSAEWDYLNQPERLERLANRYLKAMESITPEEMLVNVKAVPEPVLMVPEDETPIMVSTKNNKNSNAVIKPVAMKPSAGSVVDREGGRAEDFGRVLDSVAEGDE